MDINVPSICWYVRFGYHTTFRWCIRFKPAASGWDLCDYLHAVLFRKDARDIVSPTVAAAFLLTVWGVASIGWSDQPGSTAAKGVTFVTIFFCMGFFALRLDSVNLIRGIAFGALAALCMSLVAVAVIPQLAATTEFHDGAWRGIYSQKNVLGRAASIAIAFLFMLRPYVVGRERMLCIVGIALGFFMVFMSQSATSLGVAVMMLIIVPTVRFFSGFSIKTRLIAYIGLIILSLLVVVFISDILDGLAILMGRKADLTGRIPLWEYVINDALKRPYLGYGLGGYYTEARSYLFQDDLEWMPEQSHNGLLDLLIELGAIGLLIGFLAFSSYCTAAIVQSRFAPEPTRILCLCTVILLILFNITESNFFRPSNLFWIVFLVSAMRLSVDRRNMGRSE